MRRCPNCGVIPESEVVRIPEFHDSETCGWCAEFLEDDEPDWDDAVYSSAEGLGVEVDGG